MSDSPRNLLLDGLPEVHRDDLLSRMEFVPMELRDPLAEPGRPMPYVYFPTDGIISTLTVLDDGHLIEAATVGWEGMAGIEVFLGAAGPDNVRIVCQVDGSAWRMDAGVFRRESRVDGPFRTVVERYVRTYLVQTTQSAACNGSHSIEERLAKWIALIHDWLPDRDEFPLTHEFAAAMMGVHRPSVTLAAGALQRAGLIEYRRGRLKVLDGDALREVACGCYSVIRRAYDELGRPIRGDGPGAVLRLAALLDGARQELARSRAQCSRSIGLLQEANRVGRESTSLVRRARLLRAPLRG
jgi:CRP-like cAMP-binding protein